MDRFTHRGRCVRSSNILVKFDGGERTLPGQIHAIAAKMTSIIVPLALGKG